MQFKELAENCLFVFFILYVELFAAMTKLYIGIEKSKS